MCVFFVHCLKTFNVCASKERLIETVLTSHNKIFKQTMTKMFDPVLRSRIFKQRWNWSGCKLHERVA